MYSGLHQDAPLSISSLFANEDVVLPATTPQSEKIPHMSVSGRFTETGFKPINPEKYNQALKETESKTAVVLPSEHILAFGFEVTDQENLEQHALDIRQAVDQKSTVPKQVDLKQEVDSHSLNDKNVSYPVDVNSSPSAKHEIMEAAKRDLKKENTSRERSGVLIRRPLGEEWACRAKLSKKKLAFLEWAQFEYTPAPSEYFLPQGHRRAEKNRGQIGRSEVLRMKQVEFNEHLVSYNAYQAARAANKAYRYSESADRHPYWEVNIPGDKPFALTVEEETCLKNNLAVAEARKNKIDATAPTPQQYMAKRAVEK